MAIRSAELSIPAVIGAGSILFDMILNANSVRLDCKINKGWLEVDTVEDLEVYENLYKSGDINKFIKLSNE